MVCFLLVNYSIDGVTSHTIILDNISKYILLYYAPPQPKKKKKKLKMTS